MATSRRAHPRSRGENGLGEDGFALELGSSPLARGKPPYGVGVVGAWWLIPARAGKTGIGRLASSMGKAHPRSRGENSIVTDPPYGIRGSSPLARGKPHGQVLDAHGQGLIPARAGKTEVAVPLTGVAAAHPRSRGENLPGPARLPARPGSSPLARGKLRPAVSARGNHGLIPARAGKTPFVVAHGFLLRAHPRSRGENYGVEIELFDGYGSSPLARGKQPALLNLIFDVVAHPRSRGENIKALGAGYGDDGSSPLARGKPWMVFRTLV